MNNNRGFTLTEVLLAAVIVGVIGVALAALTTSAVREGSMGRSRQALRNEISISMRQLRNDIQNAKKVKITSDAYGRLQTLTIYQREVGSADNFQKGLSTVQGFKFRNYDFERIGPKSPVRWSDQVGNSLNRDSCKVCQNWDPDVTSLEQLYFDNPQCNVAKVSTCDAYSQTIAYTFTAGTITKTPEDKNLSPAGSKLGGRITRKIDGMGSEDTWLNNVKSIENISGYPPLPSCEFEDTDETSGGAVLTCRFLVELNGSPAVNEYVKETFVLPYGFQKPAAEEGE